MSIIATPKKTYIFEENGLRLDPADMNNYVRILMQIAAGELLKSPDDMDRAYLIELFKPALPKEGILLTSVLSSPFVMDELTTSTFAEAYFNLVAQLPKDLQEVVISEFYPSSKNCAIRSISARSFKLLAAMTTEQQTRILSKEGVVYLLWHIKQGNELRDLFKLMSKEQRALVLDGCSAHHDYLNVPLHPEMRKEYPLILEVLKR